MKIRLLLIVLFAASLSPHSARAVESEEKLVIKVDYAPGSPAGKSTFYSWWDYIRYFSHSLCRRTHR